MSFSSPSRRRLLEWAAGAVLCSRALSAGPFDFRRKDPRIRTLTYRQADEIRLEGRSIAIQPFTAGQGGKPAPPDFAPFLGRALAWAFPKSVIYLDSSPARGADILIQGQLDLFHRTGAQGLKIAVSAAVFDVSTGDELVLWNGAKKADWIRRFPTDDCLLLLADDFVATWAEPEK